MTPAEFLDALARSRLLDAAALARLRPEAGLPERLVADGSLTRYQADALLRGSTRFFLDDYKLLDRVGVGRMAGVFRAAHKLGMPVAVKILPPSKAKEADSLARFEREARLALQMDHPNVVRTYHAGSCDGLHYIAMEYLDGETLEERLAARGKLPVAEAVRIVHQALQGLRHLDEKDVVHRDLKPGNLMLAGEGTATTVKLLDIGLGRALFDEGGADDLTAAGDVIGTPDYMAPEQACDSHAADVRSDIYALGCVLYHCLTGRVPFPEKNAVQKMVKHAKEMPQLPDLAGHPEAAALTEVLWRMLAKAPSGRHATPADAARALEPFLAPPVARPVPPPPPPPPKPVAEPAGPAMPAEPKPDPDLRTILIGVGVLLAGFIVLVIVLIVVRGR